MKKYDSQLRDFLRRTGLECVCQGSEMHLIDVFFQKETEGFANANAGGLVAALRKAPCTCGRVRHVEWIQSRAIDQVAKGARVEGATINPGRIRPAGVITTSLLLRMNDWLRRQKDERHAELFTVMQGTGLRAQEVAELHVRDVRLPLRGVDETCILSFSMPRKWRKAGDPMEEVEVLGQTAVMGPKRRRGEAHTHDAVETLRDLTQRLGWEGNPHLFPFYDPVVANRRLHEALIAIGVDVETAHYSLHSLRHGFNTIMISRGYPQDKRLAQMRHRTGASEEQYGQIAIVDMD